MPKKFNAFDEKTPAPRLGSLHDVRRVVSLKENKTNHSHERVVIRPPMPKGKYEIQRKVCVNLLLPQLSLPSVPQPVSSRATLMIVVVTQSAISATPIRLLRTHLFSGTAIKSPTSVRSSVKPVTMSVLPTSIWYDLYLSSEPGCLC
jgi:hypothetical protein